MAIHLFSSEFKPLPFYFVTLDTHYAQEEVVRLRGFHDLAQLFFVEAGSGYLRVAAKEYRLEPGDAFFLDCRVPHEYGSNEGLVASWVTFRGSGMQELRHYASNRSFLYFKDLNVAKYVAALEALKGEYFGKRREGVLSVMLYSVLVDFLEEEAKTKEGEMARVLSFIEEHYAKRITIDELARLARASRSTFCKRFRASFGCTAIEKLTEVRLAAAKQMLTSFPEEKIGAIATKCGFEDAGYFCKVYKKKYGISPIQSKIYVGKE